MLFLGLDGEVVAVAGVQARDGKNSPFVVVALGG